MNTQSGMAAAIPPVIRILLVSNVVIFLLQTLFGHSFPIDGIPLMEYLTYYGSLMPASSSDFFSWQLITYQFLHGGVFHLLINMFTLWMFGSELEVLWGPRRFTTYYLLCGISAGLLHLAIPYLTGMPGNPVVGASGSIMGVLIAFGMTFPRRPIMVFPFPIPMQARTFVLMYALISLVSGAMNAKDGIAHFAHLGGMLGGYFLLTVGTPLMKLLSGQRDKARRTGSPSSMSSVDIREATFRAPDRDAGARETPSHRPGALIYNLDGITFTEDELNAILDKYAESNLTNLSLREKRILAAMSKNSGPKP